MRLSSAARGTYPSSEAAECREEAHAAEEREDGAHGDEAETSERPDPSPPVTGGGAYPHPLAGGGMGTSNLIKTKRFTV